MPITSVPNSGIDVSALRHFDREKLIYDSDLEPRERHILLAVNSFVGADGQCFPKQATIAEMTGYRRDAVNKALKGLERQNIITIKHQFRPKGQGQTSNRYFVQWDELANRDRKTIENRGVLSEHTHGCDVGAHRGVATEHTINYPIELSNDLTDQENTEEASGASSPRPLENSGEANQGGGTQIHLTGKPKDQKHSTLAQGSKTNSSAAAPRKAWKLGQPLPTDSHGYAVLPRKKRDVVHDWGCVAIAKYKAVLWTQRDIVGMCDNDGMSLNQDDDGEFWIETIDGENHESEAFAPDGDLPLRKLRDIAIHGIRGSFLSQDGFNEILQENFEMALRQELAQYGVAA